jgi:hypothetical protein
MYLTGEEIAARLLDRFTITATVGDGDAAIASAELDGAGLFIGSRLDPDQEHAFPRSVTPGGVENEDTTVPDAILDWVALCAYRISEVDAPAVKSWSRSGVSETYASSMPSQSERRMANLLNPYLATGNSTLTVSSSFNTDSRLLPWAE